MSPLTFSSRLGASECEHFSLVLPVTEHHWFKRCIHTHAGYKIKKKKKRKKHTHTHTHTQKNGKSIFLNDSSFGSVKSVFVF